MDRRIRRTHKLLVDALLTLAIRDGYDAVTIRDITDFADVSYSTFFRHFPDKDTLFMDTIAERIWELRAIIDSHESPVEGGTLAFRHVADNQTQYRTLLGGLNSSGMVQKAQQMIADSLSVEELTEVAPHIPPEISANHVAASALALLKWWLDHNMPYSPERMGEIYAALIIHPVWGVQPAVVNSAFPAT